MENHYNCIYMYVNMINNKIYIGQTKDFNKRHIHHISTSYNEKSSQYNLPFHCSIRKYGEENFNIKILKENLETQYLLNYWEMFYIEKYDTLVKNGKGYNVASGGHNGNAYAGKTEEEMLVVRKRLSDSHKGENHWNYGKKHSNETKKKISESHKGKKLSSEHKESLTKNNKRGTHPRAKKVKATDETGNIKIFNCSVDASDFIGVKRRTLQYYLRGKSKTNFYKGYYWEYID